MTGADLKAMRKEAGLRGVDMAKQIEISATMLSNYENGHRPIPLKVQLAARYLCEMANSPSQTAEQRFITALKDLIAERR